MPRAGLRVVVGGAATVVVVDGATVVAGGLVAVVVVDGATVVAGGLFVVVVGAAVVAGATVVVVVGATGLTAVDGADRAPMPASFQADTWNSYKMAGSSPIAR